MGLTFGHWLESPITGLVVAVLLAIVTTAIAWWNIRPKRLIVVDIPQRGTPFLKAESHSRPGSVVDQTGSGPESPHIVKVHLKTKGRWDVASTAFDRDLPLILDIGATILSMEVVQPPWTPRLKAEVAGTELRIGPGLVPRRRMWVFTLLTNGIASCFTYVNPLIDIDIRTAVQQRRRRLIFLSIPASFMQLSAGLFTALIFLARLLPV